MSEIAWSADWPDLASRLDLWGPEVAGAVVGAVLGGVITAFVVVNLTGRVEATVGKTLIDHENALAREREQAADKQRLRDRARRQLLRPFEEQLLRFPPYGPPLAKVIAFRHDPDYAHIPAATQEPFEAYVGSISSATQAEEAWTAYKSARKEEAQKRNALHSPMLSILLETLDLVILGSGRGAAVPAANAADALAAAGSRVRAELETRRVPYLEPAFGSYIPPVVWSEAQPLVWALHDGRMLLEEAYFTLCGALRAELESSLV